MSLRLVIVLMALLSAVACSDSRQWQGTIEERDGVVYVRNRAAGLWDGALRQFLPGPLLLEESVQAARAQDPGTSSGGLLDSMMAEL